VINRREFLVTTSTMALLGQGAWAERGKVVARSPAQRAAVAAVVKYLAVRVELTRPEIPKQLH